MLLPKRVKYRRQQRGRMKGKALRGNFVSNGEYGLQALEPAWITSNQIEAARVALPSFAVCDRQHKAVYCRSLSFRLSAQRAWL